MKKHLGTLLYAVLAGFCIGIGGNVFLALMPTNKIMGAALFTVGLFTICSFGFNLFTGKVCYVFDQRPSYLITVAEIWVGNLLGTWLMAELIHMTRLGESFTQTAQELCKVKVNDSLLSLFVLGIICNVLIYIAVEGYRTIPHEVGKYLALIFGVMVFILIGTEHSVADMYYFAMAGYLWHGKSLLCLLVITLGNAVGGILFPLIRKWKTSLDKTAP